jgi:hypothetical protein
MDIEAASKNLCRTYGCIIHVAALFIVGSTKCLE